MSIPADKDVIHHFRPFDDFKAEEELLIKKKRILEDKAPGLFDYLTKFIVEEASTETASTHSGDHKTEESKHTIHIPSPIKTQSLHPSINLSNVVKANPQKGPNEEVFQGSTGSEPTSLWSGGAVYDKAFEEKQRQQILQMSMRNSLMLNGVTNQIDTMRRSAMQCVADLQHLRGHFNESQKTPLERIEQIKEEKKHSTQFDSNPTPQALFNHLFGAPNLYKYELILDFELPIPIFRERNLIIKAKLIDILSQKPVENHNKVLMHLALQTWEIPSNPILRNKSGNKAVMGDTEVELRNGEAIFDRIQINEVTSKFIHGYVAVMIVPSKPCNIGTSLAENEVGHNYVDYESIKPLMLEKVVVKSKKKNPKKKDE